MDIQKDLLAMADPEYRDFHSRLMPNIDKENIIGIRVPELRKYAREISDSDEAKTFLNILPHRYYDENMLHGLLIERIKDIDECYDKIDAFLPYVDNWAVCDIMSPKILKKDRERLIGKIYEWSSSKHTYVCRFGIEMLMSYFLDEYFKKEYLELPAEIVSEEYYVRMMIAWFFATALAKQWDDTVPYIENRRLDEWTHRKAIQKAVESYRITDEQKAYLKSLK